jgi:hypothetical protein
MGLFGEDHIMGLLGILAGEDHDFLPVGSAGIPFP